MFMMTNKQLTPRVVKSATSLSEAPSMRFAVAARVVVEACHAEGIEVPAFRTPPKTKGIDRAIRRSELGSIVSVRIIGRPFLAVIADLVEGAVICNQFAGSQASSLRNVLWIQIVENLQVVETLLSDDVACNKDLAISPQQLKSANAIDEDKQFIAA